MFDYMFNMNSIHEQLSQTSGRYGIKEYFEGVPIRTFKAEETLRYFNQNTNSYEYQVETVYFTQSEIAIEDRIDGLVVNSVKVVEDIFGDFLYFEVVVDG